MFSDDKSNRRNLKYSCLKHIDPLVRQDTTFPSVWFRAVTLTAQNRTRRLHDLRK
jgi:hypothetical protein